MLCPECHEPNEFDDEHAIGTQAVCRHCGGKFLVEAPLGADEKACPVCGERIKQSARKCRHCGEMLEGSPVDDERVKEEAKRLVREQQDGSTSLQLLVTGILGCFSPILAIYGLIFLVRRPYSFPRKPLAVIGTVLHCFWTLILIGMIVLNVLVARR
jgi:hypothetical protein